jgi:branched-chain amino acid transport system ATP-binding protein
VLEITDVHTYYGESHVLQGVSLAVAPGEVVGLLGRNGMGKTTLIRSIIGFTPPRRGTVRFNGADITRWPPYRAVELGMGLVPQGRRVFPSLTVKENLEVARRTPTHTTGKRLFPRRDLPTARHPRSDPSPAPPIQWTLDRVYGLFPRLSERARNRANKLSGGEQQMLAIGRALMTNPRLLILDEATEGLAPLIRAEIWRCLGQLRAAGQAILVIDKNVAALTRLADRHHLIERGRVVWTGTSAELAAAPDVQHRYLGI